MTHVELALSRDEARWLAVIASGLDRRPNRRKPTASDILETVRKLGSVQLDTISVISRSHETVLWSRLGPFDPLLIQSLYDPGLALTEYLAHAAAIIPSDTLPLFRGVMERYQSSSEWGSQLENRLVMDRVLAHIEANGPTESRHFDRPDDGREAKAWEWYGLKPERRALDALWLRGETILRLRDAGFSRVFDLPERVQPGFWDQPMIPDGERDRAFLRKALSVLGVGTARWLSDYFRTGGPAHVSLARTRELMRELEASGEAVRVVVPHIADPTWIDPMLAERVDDLRVGRGRPSLTTFLSPFDNLVWNRLRDEQLFDFEYRLECYTPAPKRKYGYYTLPVLYRGRVVGRLDPSYDRRKRFLTIRSMHLEPWVRPSESMLASIRGAIEDLLRFLGGDRGAWTLQEANPSRILSRMQPDLLIGALDAT